MAEAAKSLLLQPFSAPNLPGERSPPRKERDILITRGRRFRGPEGCVRKARSGFTIYYAQSKPLLSYQFFTNSLFLSLIGIKF